MCLLDDHACAEFAGDNCVSIATSSVTVVLLFSKETPGKFPGLFSFGTAKQNRPALYCVLLVAQVKDSAQNSQTLGYILRHAEYHVETCSLYIASMVPPAVLMTATQLFTFDLYL